ncbi:MAG: diguanylate cyclase [Fimbriimonadales bacterium]
MAQFDSDEGTTMKVLIAEDSTVTAKLLDRQLRSEGFETLVALDGKQAWELYQRELPPIVITDWEMPGMDGVDLCRAIRNHQTESYTYVIMLTARNQKNDKLEALDAGADDFLSKPPDPAELCACLKTAQRILKAEQRLYDQNIQLREMYEELQNQNEMLLAAQKLVEHANRRFAELFEHVPVACFTFDGEGILHEWNQAAEQLYGYTKSEVLFTSMFEKVFRGDVGSRVLEVVQHVMRGSSLTGVESADVDAEGNMHYVLRSAIPLRNPSGEVVGGIMSVVDVTYRVEAERQLKLLNEQLQNLAITDGLTGLRNRRAFEEHLIQEVSEAKRFKTPIALLMIDVDHFKQFNDTFGHALGDEVLRAVASILAREARQSDIVARYGGEEFAVIMPHTDLTSAMLAAERFRRTVEAHEGFPRSITISVGVAQYLDEMSSHEDLVKLADQALYRAKGLGRNRVCANGYETFLRGVA